MLQMLIKGVRKSYLLCYANLMHLGKYDKCLEHLTAKLKV